VPPIQKRKLFVDGLERVYSFMDRGTGPALKERLTAFTQIEFDDGDTANVPVALEAAFVAMNRDGVVNVTYFGSAQFTERELRRAGGEAPRSVGYGFAMDGKPVGEFVYDEPFRCGGRIVDWTSPIPLQDLATLRSTLKGTPQEASRIASGGLVFSYDHWVETGAAIQFVKPVPCFTSVSPSAIQVDIVVPSWAEHCVAYDLNAVKLTMANKIVALVPTLPCERIFESKHGVSVTKNP
jgi:hypothetical protein